MKYVDIAHELLKDVLTQGSRFPPRGFYAVEVTKGVSPDAVITWVEYLPRVIRVHFDREVVEPTLTASWPTEEGQS